MGGGNGKEEVGLRPTTRWGRKAPDPFSGGSPHTRHDGTWVVTFHALQVDDNVTAQVPSLK